jgi:hypothetical protein
MMQTSRKETLSAINSIVGRLYIEVYSYTKINFNVIRTKILTTTIPAVKQQNILTQNLQTKKLSISLVVILF